MASTTSTRKRELNLKKGDADKTHSTDHQLSGWNTLMEYDAYYSKMIGVCSTSNALLGHYRPLMKLLELSCHGVPWFAGTIVVFLCMHKPDDVEILVNLFLGLAFDVAIVCTLKMLFRRQRPSSNEHDMFLTLSVDNFSFPSGHASRAMFLMCFFLGHIATGPVLTVSVMMWSVCVSISRIVLGRHHITDVMTGLLIGFVEYLLYCQLWVPKETCLRWLESYYGHVHL